MGLMLLISYFEPPLTLIQNYPYWQLLPPCPMGWVEVYIAQNFVAFVTQMHRNFEINKQSFEMPNYFTPKAAY